MNKYYVEGYYTLNSLIDWILDLYRNTLYAAAPTFGSFIIFFLNHGLTSNLKPRAPFQVRLCSKHCEYYRGFPLPLHLNDEKRFTLVMEGQSII